MLQNKIILATVFLLSFSLADTPKSIEQQQNRLVLLKTENLGTFTNCIQKANSIKSIKVCQNERRKRDLKVVQETLILNQMIRQKIGSGRKKAMQNFIKQRRKNRHDNF